MALPITYDDYVNELGRLDINVHEPPNDLSRLAFHKEKRSELSDDVYFREAWSDLCEVHDDPIGLAHGIALFSFKPDVLPTRKAKRALALIKENGFEIVDFWRFQHNRHSMRELWRYNWHLYPPDRLDMCTLLHTVAPTIVLLLRDAHPVQGVPASVRLTSLKGAADPSKRRPGQIRTELQPPNAVINHVHVADEPIDVLREVAIFADRRQRRTAFSSAAAVSTPTQALMEAVEMLEADVPAISFDIESVLIECCREWQWNSTVEREVIASVRGGQSLTLGRLYELMPGATGGKLVWYFLLVASYVLPAERATGAPSDLLRAGSTDDWMRSNAER